MPEAYTREHRSWGRVKKEVITVIYVPRDDFVMAMRDVIHPYEDRLTDTAFMDLLYTAESMPSFPISEWLHSTRGCGCLVGEALTARAALKDVSRTNLMHDFAALSMSTMLHDYYGPNDSVWLYSIGAEADRAVRQLLRDNVEDEVLDYGYPEAIIII